MGARGGGGGNLGVRGRKVKKKVRGILTNTKSRGA